MAKYINDSIPKNKHISFEEAVANGRRFLSKSSGVEAFQKDRELLEAYNLLKRAESVLRLTEGKLSDHPDVIKALGEEAKSAVYRTVLFKAGGDRERALKEIAFRLSVIEALCAKRNLDPEVANG